MYGREYGGEELDFEPSGGLLHASLVMQDKQTDSYWSIMTGDSLAGRFQGTPLRELPLGEKMQWKDWKARHPASLVLSVDGEEHIRNNPYDNYFDSRDGFRGARAKDRRLPTKAPIYSFELGGEAFAVPFDAYQGSGAVFNAGKDQIFLYRPKGVEIFYSTRAWVGEAGSFEKRDGAWVYKPTGARFDPHAEGFTGGEHAPATLCGFDTFWFNWSMIHEGSRILGE